MAYNRYLLSVKSKEQRGGTQPNIVRLAFNSDADALTFEDNLNICVSGHVSTVDKVLSENYASSYPVGSGWSVRMALRSADGHEWQMRLQDWDTTKNVATLCSDLIAAGVKAPWIDGPTAVSITPTLFPPTTFLG